MIDALSLNQALFSSSDKILLAVSGGVDSMVMLDLFNKFNDLNIGIAHVNYHLRGSDSHEDELFVTAMARKHDIPIHIHHADIQQIGKLNPPGLQAQAREIRYSFFNEICLEFGYTKVATAHHQLDRLETFLFNLSRGSGLNGLTSIPVRNNAIIRPLLHWPKERILEYARKNQINYREDITNLETKYTRNKIRHNLIPEFQKIQSSAVRNMNISIDILNQYRDLIQSFFDEHRSTWTSQQSDRLVIHLTRLPQQHLFVILHELTSHLKTTPTQIINIIQAYQNRNSGALFYTASHTIGFADNDLIVEPNKDWVVSTDIFPGINPISGRSAYLKMSEVEFPEKWPVQRHIAYLNGSMLKFPLRLRTWEPGDRFRPLGMGGKSKKVQDLLTDLKVPRLDKMKTLVLLSADEICWVIGHGISESYKIETSLDLIYRFEIIKKRNLSV